MANERPNPAALAKPAGKQKTVLDVITEKKADFARVIPRHLNPERMIRIAQSAISRNPRLLACSAPSLLRSVMEASIMGLEIGVLGEGYLIPYGTDCQFQPGYQGLLKLAIQSKAVTAIYPGAVRQGDEFDYELGSDPFLRHKPSMDTDPNEQPYAFYVVLKLPSGEKQITVMSKAAVDRIRKRSKSSGKPDSPWNTDYEMMGVKTVIKRGLKYVPKTPELARAIEHDDRREMGEETKDLFAGDLPDLLPGESAVDVTPQQQSTADEAAQVLSKPAEPVDDDIPFETKEEEESRKK